MAKTFKPTLSKPTKMGKKLNKHFNKELTKQSSMQQVNKPNIKIKEDKDDFAMKQSGYNDLGIGKLKTNRKKDLDPSFKELTFESLDYIDESDNQTTSSLKTIRKDIYENKKLITKKELIESTLKEEKNDYVYYYAGPSGESGENEGTKDNPFTVLKVKGHFNSDSEDKARTIAHKNNLKLIGGLFHGSLNVINRDGYYQGSYYKIIEVPFETKPTEDLKGKFIEQMIEYESGNLSDEDILELFSHLVKSKMVNSLQGHYGRMANELMSMGYLSSKGDILKFSLNEKNDENNKEEIIDETTTSSSSGQFQTPFAWAPNKKGWANAKKRWWGENSPNTGGSISKGGVVNIKDSCKGYSNNKTQCNSGDIGNITITEEAQNLIAKLSKEYNKPVEYIKNLIKEDYCNKVTSLKHELNNISDKEISQFVTKQLIKEGYLPEKQNNEEDIETKVREIVANEFDYENWSEEQNQAIEVCMRCYEAAKSSNGYSEKDIRKVLFKLVGEYEGIVDFNKWIDTEIQYLNKSTQKEGYLSINELKQTKDNWRGEGCKNYDDSRDICLDKKVNELYLQDRPIYKHKKTGEVWEASEVGYRDITLVNLKNPTMIINVDKEELKNEYIKLGSGIEENSPPNYTGSYGSYKDVEGDMSLMSPDITENKLK